MGFRAVLRSGCCELILEGLVLSVVFGVFQFLASGTPAARVFLSIISSFVVENDRLESVG